MRRGRFMQLLAGGTLAARAVPAAAAETGFWAASAPIPDARVGAAVAASESRIHVIGGFAARGERLHQAFDPRENRWSDLAPPPAPLNYAAAASAGSRIFVFGGFSDTYAPKYRHALDSAYAYDAAGNAWSTIAPLPKPRGALVAVERRGTIHAIGGRDDSDALAFHYRYDPKSDSWETLAPLPTARSGASAVYLGGFIYVLGGNVAGSNAFTGALEAYDPLEDRWRYLTPMPVARSNFGAGVLTSAIVAFGGQSIEGTLRSTLRYEPERDQWTDAAQMPGPRQSFVTARLENALYAIGGARTVGLAVPTTANEAFAFY